MSLSNLFSLPIKGELKKDVYADCQKKNFKNYSQLLWKKIKSKELSKQEYFINYSLLTEIECNNSNFQEALRLNLISNNYSQTLEDKITSLHKRGRVYYKWTEIDKIKRDSSYYYLNQSLALCDTLYPKLKIENLKLLSLLNDSPNESILLLNKALDLAKKNKLENQLIKLSLLMYNSFTKMKNHKRAIDCLLDIKTTVDNLENPIDKLTFYQTLSIGFQNLGDQTQEILSLKKVIELTKVINDLEKATITSKAQTKYENEFQSKLNQLKKKPKIIRVVLGLFLISLLFLLFYRRLNKKLSQLNIKLKKSVELNKEIFSILSHDLKQPIISLEAMFFLMEQDQVSEIENNNNRNIIKNHLKTTSLFLDDIMTWAKLEITKAEQLEEVIKPQKLIDSIIDLYQTEILEKSLIFEYQNLKNIDFKGNKMLNYIILKNLIHNAIKFSHNNSKITISHNFVKNKHQFSVKNYGQPIPFELREKLFDANKKLKYLVRNDSKLGFGLGLSIVSGLIKDNNGKIWLHPDADESIVKISFYTC